MTMNANALGTAMLVAWNGETPDVASINTLGDKLYDRAMEIRFSQETRESDGLGREFWRKIAQGMLEEFYTDQGAVALDRWKAVAAVIVAHIAANATIAPLSTTSTPNDGAAHIHTPITVESTGKIS